MTDWSEVLSKIILISSYVSISFSLISFIIAMVYYIRHRSIKNQPYTYFILFQIGILLSNFYALVYYHPKIDYALPFLHYFGFGITLASLYCIINKLNYYLNYGIDMILPFYISKRLKHNKRQFSYLFIFIVLPFVFSAMVKNLAKIWLNNPKTYKVVNFSGDVIQYLCEFYFSALNLVSIFKYRNTIKQLQKSLGTILLLLSIFYVVRTIVLAAVVITYDIVDLVHT